MRAGAALVLLQAQPGWLRWHNQPNVKKPRRLRSLLPTAKPGVRRWPSRHSGKETSGFHFPPGPRSTRHLPSKQAKHRPLSSHSGLPNSPTGCPLRGGCLGGLCPHYLLSLERPEGGTSWGVPHGIGWGGQECGPKGPPKGGVDTKELGAWGLPPSPLHISAGTSLGSSLLGSQSNLLLSAHNPGPAHMA